MEKQMPMDMRQKSYIWFDKIEIIQDAIHKKLGYKNAKIFMARTILQR